MARFVEALAPERLGTPFRWLMASSWTAHLADGIDIAAGPLLIASLTHNAVLVALALALQRLPWLLFGLVAGVVADRLDRRRIIIVVGLGRAVVLAALSATIITEQVTISMVLGAMFLLGTADAFADTTSTTFLPMLVDKADLGIANARLMAGFVTINQLAGAPIGAALFAVNHALPFLTQTVCMLASAAMASRIELRRGVDATKTRSHVRQEIADGMRWLWGNSPVRTLALTIVSFNITFGAAWSVLVLYATQRLHTGDIGFGLLTTASAVGGVVGTAMYGRLTARFSLGNIMRVGLLIETLTHLALAITTRPWVALLIMFAFGAHASVWGTTSTTVRQRAVPIELQGRVSSVYLIGVQGGIVAGSAIGGAVAGAWGITAPFWFGFVGSSILLSVIWRQLARIAHADEATLAGPAPPAAERPSAERPSGETV